MPTYSIQSHPLENLIEVDVDLLLNLLPSSSIIVLDVVGVMKGVLDNRMIRFLHVIHKGSNRTKREMTKWLSPNSAAHNARHLLHLRRAERRS